MNSKDIKRYLGGMVFGLRLHRFFFKDKAVIAVFHRVNNNIPENPITCDIELFTQFCAFFKRYFNIISLSELLDRIESGRSISGCLVVTFDDGYLDNFENAAPILKEFDIPACFFIATDFIGTQRVPDWDKKWGVESEWMTWDHVKSLSSDGFEIGAHTKNHVDLGVVEGDDARDEIQESRLALERQLGKDIDLFSFPFGRESQFSESNRSLVKELRFRCSPSAYGGIVRPNDDPFRMRRHPISPWHESVWQFGFELLQEG